MDAKEIKSLLKQAREAIKEKEYKTAIKHCKAILKADKENYNGWVFIAAAMQETEMFEQAEEAFHRAIEIAPDQLLAYQGLATFYDKQNKQDKHVDVLIKMAKILANDKDKLLEIIEKIGTLIKSLDNKGKVVEFTQLQLDVMERGSKKEFEFWRTSFKELSIMQDFTEPIRKLLNAILEKILGSPLFTNKDFKDIIVIYKDPKYKDKFTDESAKLIKAACTKFKDEPFCVEFLIKDTIHFYMEYLKVDENFQDVFSITIEKNNVLQNIVQVMLLISNKQYLTAMEELKTILKANSSSVESWFLLCKVQLQLHQYRDAEQSSKTGLQLAIRQNMSSKIIGNFYLFLGKALSGNKSWENSLKALEKSVECLNRSHDVLVVFCYTLLEIDMINKAEKMYNEIVSSFGSESPLNLQLCGYIHLLKKEYPEALQKLKESCKDNSFEEKAFSLHLIGRTLSEMEQHDKAFEVFFKAAELDPFYTKNFLCLGQYYMQIARNKMKAVQCYQKAFDLDNYDDEIARYLSNALRILGDDENNFKVLKRITELASPGSCKWAWTQLGLYQLERDLIPEAILSFQRAVRADPMSSYGWQCLGEAYLKRGSYESAFKSFEKASELDPKAMYPLYQVATIQNARSLYDEAIEKYKNLLNLDSTYIPALIGLAESCLLLSKMHLKDCLFGRASDCIQETLNVLAKVAVINVNLLSLWTLAGEACTLCFHLGRDWFPIIVPPELLALSNKNSSSFTKEEILSFGSRFYGQALALKNNVSSLWHDLGVNCYFQSKVMKSPAKEEFSKKAFICLQNAVSISPHNHEHWTLLGITAVNQSIEDYALGQHAFIKSIEIEPNNAEAWTNLGILYLQQSNIRLAHNCFKMAQSLDPSFPISWLGQAVIADSVHDSEKVDLYRHTLTLCSHEEALIGYGRNVCMALLDTSKKETEFYKYNIEEMDAVYVAAEYMQKYTANNNFCAEAFMFSGILYERQHLYNSALNAFERAVNLFTNEGKMENIENARINYARVLCKIGQPENAVVEYLKLKKVDVFLLCSFAYALYQNKNFEKASEMFQRAADLCASPTDKSHILVAMAIIAWQCSDISTALRLLVQSVQIKNPSVYGLLALRAIGIMKNDAGVAASVQKSLQPVENDKKYISSITLLNAIESFSKNGPLSARNVFLKAIKLRPNNHLIWMQAASCLLQWNSNYEKVVTICTEVASFHGGNKELAAQISALSNLACGKKITSLRNAQKAVHIHPDKVHNWVTLAAACHMANVNRNHIGWIFNFVKVLVKQQGARMDLVGWLTVLEAYHYIYNKNYNIANRLLEQASKITAFDSKILSVLQVLHAYLHILVESDKIDPIVHALQKNPGTFLGWQLLIQVLLKSEKFDEAEKTLAQFIMTSSKLFPNLKHFPFIQIGLLSYKAMKMSGNKDKWLKVGNEALGEAVKISPNNKSVRFLQGLISLKAENLNLARRSFEKVTFSSMSTESLWMENYSSELLKNIYKQKNDNEALEKLSNWSSSGTKVLMN